MIAQGKSGKEVASALGLSVKTIETHRSHIFQKLKMHSVAEVTRHAVRYGWVEV